MHADDNEQEILMWLLAVGNGEIHCEGCSIHGPVDKQSECHVVFDRLVDAVFPDIPDIS